MGTSGRFVALLRGINVGRAKRVAMGDLRRIFEDLGFRDVRTLLNSGNVVFQGSGDPAKLASKIEKAIAAKTGVSSRVLVIAAQELDAIVAANRLADRCTNPSRMFVGFLFAPCAALKTLGGSKWGQEAFASGPRAAYLWCPNGVLKSPLGQAFERAVKDAVTVRNWATVSKLHALVRVDATAKPSRKKG